MKKTLAFLFVSMLSFAGIVSAHAEAANSGLQPGEWISNFCNATNYATEIKTPMVMVWSGEHCKYCDALKATFNTMAFKTWQEESGYVFCLVEGTKDGRDKGENLGSGAVSFASDKKYGNARANGFPYVTLYWPAKTGTIRTNFTGRVGTMLVNVKTGTETERLRESFCQSADLIFAAFGRDTDGKFAVTDTGCDRLECEAGTTFVSVPLVREGLVLEEATQHLTASNSLGVVEYEISWEEDQETAEVVVATAEEDVTLRLYNAEGELVDQSAITYVEHPHNNPKNPLWFGERDLATLATDEWTMDRDLALAKAQLTGGSTLTVVGGSLWCPDCVNADAYLIDTTVFKDWAANNGVYCAAIDVPLFPWDGNTCLLTYTPTTVSDRYVNATVPPQERVQSGAGYRSRKMIPETGNGGTNAVDILARNLYLTTNSVAVGGLCRPECIDPANTDTGVWKTGLPCFIMQNAAGRITGRLYQFNNVSPTSTESVSAYVQRLEELRDLADDPTEELNKHWSTATTEDCELSIRGGEVYSTISAIDTSDYWRLTGRDCWTRVRFAVKGAGGTSKGDNAILCLWKRTGNTVQAVTATKGNLATGFEIPYEPIPGGTDDDYFIQLQVIETSEDFMLEHMGDSTVSYVLTAEFLDDGGEIAFVKSEGQASEAEAKKAGGTLHINAPLIRTGGFSGATNVAITVDEELTTAYADRYGLVTDSVSWADGESGAKNVEIEVYDDGNADGTQVLVLRAGDSLYELTIIDNDKMNTGTLSLSGAVPACAKKGLVIAEEASTVVISVSRIGGASGDVGCTLKTTAGAFESSTDLWWRSRESGAQPVLLKLPSLEECPTGKAVVSFDELYNIKADSSTRTMTIQLVGKDAPRFEVSEKSLSLVRYCAVSQTVALVNLSPSPLSYPKITKLSGTIPGGLTIKLVDEMLQITGIPTKAGSYEAVYQVSETLGRVTTPGLTIRLVMTVTDVAALDPWVPGANPAVATSRRFGDMTVVDGTARRMTGVLTGLTIPPTGKCSAKYKCSEGTISLSAKSWETYDASDGTLTATLTVSRRDYALRLWAYADGRVDIMLFDPEFEEGILTAEVPETWGVLNPATDWMGYYTAAVLNPDGPALANGCPTLTMKMQTLSAAKSGTMTYAGTLPNGQAFSGSSTLVKDGLSTVLLPVYYRTTKEFFTMAPQIKADAPAKAVTCGDKVLPWWTHTETLPDACFELPYLRIAGSYYDRDVNLLETLNPTAQGHDLAAVDAIDPIPVYFTEKMVTLDPLLSKVAQARLSFTKSTGLISGSFKTTNSAGKVVTATYKGVALPDWGDGCPSCGDVPWAAGAFWYTDSIEYELSGRTRTFSVKAGDTLYIESN